LPPPRNYRIGKAFTLAEVLITLGIIGVVAAITMPTVINNIQNKVNIVRWKKSYAIVYEAVKRVMNKDISICERENCAAVRIPNITNYEDIYFSNEFIEAFIEELNPIDKCFPNIPKHCINKKWVRTRNYTLLNKPNAEVAGYNYGAASLLLKDGSVVYIGGSHGGPWLSVDVNGPLNKPNQVGRDFFIIKVFQDKILPLGAQGTFNKQYNGEQCLCGEQYGLQTGNPYFAGEAGKREVISGGCCSAYYLLK